LIRELLLEYEGSDEWLHLIPGMYQAAPPEERRKQYHVLLLIDEGLAVQVGDGTFRLTSQGHDYIDAIRSDNVWKKTKDAASIVGGAGLSVLRELAVAYLKEEVGNRLGITL
jgi:hypothetical protein